MLYSIYDIQRQMLEPFSTLAQAMSQTLSQGPWSVFPLVDKMSAGWELTARFAKTYEKPSFGITQIARGDEVVAIIEHVVAETPFCRLLRFKRLAETPKTSQALSDEPKVLIVAPLSGHHATLLRDTVTTMLQDHDVYITDWRDARTVPLSDGLFGLDSYVDHVREFLTLLGPSTHVVAVCQPVVPVLGAVALMSAKAEGVPASMVLIGGPVDARESPTAVNNLATRQPLSWFEQNVIHPVPSGHLGVGRRVYPGFLQHLGFVAMNPEKHFESHFDFFKNLVKGDKESARVHRAFYDEYNAVLDMDAKYYIETIQLVFQDFALPEGKWFVHGQKVDPSKIRHTALLTIEGGRDDIAGQGQTKAAHKLCENIPENKKEHLLSEKAGHYGLFSGRRFREEIYPQIKTFIEKNKLVESQAKRKSSAPKII